MFFRNLTVFRLKSPIDAAQINAALENAILQPCLPSSMQSIGWISPRQTDVLAHVVNQQILIALGVEQRLLPASVIKQHVQDRVKTIEENEGRRVGRREIRELSEAVTAELLPRAFVRRRTTFCWIDPVHGWLVIDTAAPAKTDELIEQLHRSIDSLQLAPVKVTQSPCSAMTGWLADSEAPARFSIDQDTELQSAEHATVRYAKHALDGDDIPSHIASGKIVTRLGMTWADKISFVLTDKLQLKRVCFLDILKEASEGQAENEEERFDIDFTLMTGEVANLLHDLLQALGGEVVGGLSDQSK